MDIDEYQNVKTNEVFSLVLKVQNPKEKEIELNNKIGEIYWMGYTNGQNTLKKAYLEDCKEQIEKILRLS